MICERCEKNEATVHMTQLINNKKEEHHLCAECANHVQGGVGTMNLFDAFKSNGIFDDFLLKNDFFTQALYPQGSVPHHVKRCSQCNSSFADFNRTGRLGCAQCYKAFPEVESLVRRVQGSTAYEGRYPKRGANVFYQARKIQELRHKIEELVRQEQYEEAAKLRDQIKELEGKGINEK